MTCLRRNGVDVCGFIGGWSPDDPLGSESVDKRYLLTAYDGTGRSALYFPMGREGIAVLQG